MPVSVPALERAGRILQHLAAQPRRRFTLSELARACDISKATAASILSELETQGLLLRDADLRYYLGDGILSLAESRRAHFSAFEATRKEMTKLAGATGLSVAAIARDGNDLVILDMLGDPQPTHLHMRIGMRVPLEPPIGTIFKAWSAPEEIDDWVDRLIHEFGGDRHRHLSRIAAIRTRRYSLGGEQDLDLELEHALARLNRHDGDARALEVALVVADKIRNVNTDSTNQGQAPVNSVIGPVFDSDGRVSLTLNLYGPLGTVRRSDLATLVPTLLETATAVTERTGGRLPNGWRSSI